MPKRDLDITFVNNEVDSEKSICKCEIEISDGYGEYSDVVYIWLCDFHKKKVDE